MAKKIFLLSSISFALLSSFATGWCFAEDRRPNKAAFTIMTLNTEFMWDGIEPEEGQVDFDRKHSKTEAAEHMEKIADIIRCSNPDIVHLVEVENEQAVDKLNDNYLEGQGYHVYFIQGKDTYTGQDVALLTRVDPNVFVTKYVRWLI